MSLKGDKYETVEEVQFRLNNTVVLYEGKPVYITRVQFPEGGEGNGKEIARVHFVELPYGGKYEDLEQKIARQAAGLPPVKEVPGGPKEVRKYLSSKNFDLAPFKMGYFNHGGEATFASRVPVRQNQQGLGMKTLSLVDVKGKPSGTLNFSRAIASQGFYDMISGKFPSFAEVGDMLGDKENASVAVSRQFALHIDHDLEALLLMHKGVKCGLAIKGDKQIRIPEKYKFLRQEAEECRIPLA